MKLFCIAFAILAAACAIVKADVALEFKSPQLTMSVDARENANLIYQLDCMAELIHCAPNVFQNMWRDELQFDAADHARLDEWKAVRGAIDERGAKTDPTLKIAASLPLLGPDDDTVWNRVRWAGFVTADSAELDAAWARCMSPHELATSRVVLEHFRPRFHRWWAANEDTASTFAPALKAALDKARGFDLIVAATHFYGADLGDGHLLVHLLVLPKGKRTITRAERIGSHLNVEIVPGENPEFRVDVVVHELAHHVFALMPATRKAEFMERMLQAGDGAVPAWNLFDEVQATSIGNIIAGRNVSDPARFQKMWDRPRAFYSEEAIDLGARASYGLFDRAFAAGGAMPENFPADYVQAMRQGLAGKLETPATYLNSMAIINLDARDKDRKRQLRLQLHSSSVWGFDAEDRAHFAAETKRFRALSAVVFVRTDGIAQLDGFAHLLAVSPADMRQALGSSAGVIFIAKRSPTAYTFILAARDDASMDALVGAVAQCPMQPGVCKRI